MLIVHAVKPNRSIYFKWHEMSPVHNKLSIHSLAWRR